MADLNWGLLGPESLPGSRRVRTLGLSPSVRRFNDRAVPGIGGAWLGKQILLAELGVHVATLANERNIETANAIEALACWLAFKRRDWAPDPRLRGNRKLQGPKDRSYQSMRQRSYYVTIPMRMGTVQTLPALGLVESASGRFNAFNCTQAGLDLIQAATEDCRPYKSNLVHYLVRWVRGEEDRIAKSDALHEALSPIIPLPASATAMLHDRLLRGGNSESEDDTKRRRDALQWVDSQRNHGGDPLSWSVQPREISSVSHWQDLHAGALFFRARDLALELLDALEARMPAERKLPLNDKLGADLERPLQRLREAALAFLDIGHRDTLANVFCRECTAPKSVSVLHSLVGRDDRVLRLQGAQVCSGPAFRGYATGGSQDETDPDIAAIPQPHGFPQDISRRVPNLFLLNLDLHGQLESYLTAEKTKDARQ